MAALAERKHIAERKLPSLHDFFAPSGLLSRSGLQFEHRKGQYEMARAIEKAFADKRHLIVEAGTGTGKTLAYLLPALRLARERQQRVIISTGTKNLQEQLFFKDVPFLESILGPLKVCYMKGRNNYLCKHKLYALRDSPLLTGLEEIGQFHAIAAWEKTTATGDRAEIDALPENSALWPKLDARGEACLGQTCPDWENCFITAMRRKALESDIVIVNHHLFFADMAIKLQAGAAPDAGVLPAAGAVIFDEAHELEDIASNFFGIGLSTQRFDELARDVETMLRAKRASTPAIESATATLRERARMFFAALPYDAASSVRGFHRRSRRAAQRQSLRRPRPHALRAARRVPGRTRRHLHRRAQRPRPPGGRTGPAEGRRRSSRPAQAHRRHRNPPQVPARIAGPQHRLLD